MRWQQLPLLRRWPAARVANANQKHNRRRQHITPKVSFHSFIDFPIIWWLLLDSFWSFHFLERKLKESEWESRKTHLHCEKTCAARPAQHENLLAFPEVAQGGALKRDAAPVQKRERVGNAKKKRKDKSNQSVSFPTHFVHFPIIWWLLSTIFWSFHFSERMKQRGGRKE